MTTATRNLEAVLKNFTFQELCDIALQEFPEITWKEIRNTIIAHSETFNTKNVIKILIHFVKDKPVEDIEQRISNLLLLAVGKSTRKTWTSFELLNNEKSVKKIELETIKSFIRRTGMLANINMKKMNNKYVLSIERKIITKKRVLRKQSPIYFQFFANEPYIFSTRKIIENKLMNAIVEALGYSMWKLCHLSGPNIDDLLILLKNKKSSINDASLLFAIPEPSPVIRNTENAVEFGQSNERENYANKLFGENPPQLQKLSVSLKNCTWQQNKEFVKMNGTSLDGVEVTFKAKNIAELFKEMIILGAVNEPIPEYMKAVLYAGKNEMKITNNCT